MRPLRLAIGSGLAVMLVVLASYVVREVPSAAFALVGAPRGGVARYGGLAVHDRRPDGTTVTLEYPHLPEDAVPDVLGYLRGHGLEMREVRETSHLAPSPEDDVTLDIDHWHDEAGDRHEVPFLRGPSREALERAAERSRHARLGFERVVVKSAERRGLFWRTYELADEVSVDGSMIASAYADTNPYSGGPEVTVNFTRDGTERFCDLTRRLAGRKLATVLGDRVRSAPIINGPICGGRATITIGGSVNPERDATALAAVLSEGAMPPGGEVVDSAWTPAPDLATKAWLARVMLGLVAGLFAALIVFGVLRATRPAWRERATFAGPFPGRRLAMTLLAPAVLLVGAYVTLPGINEIELAFVGMRSGFHASGIDSSVLALGIMPIITAFVLVELVALAVPRLRWRRHDARGRVRLGQATAALAIGVAFVQGYFVAVYWESLARGGAEIVVHPGMGFRLIVALSLVSGTLVLAIVAGMVREHGLGNGYGALILAGTVIALGRIELDRIFEQHLLVDAAAVAWILGAVAIVAGTVAMLRARVAGGDREPVLRLPTSGISPLADAPAIVTMIGGIAMIAGSARTESISRWVVRASTSPVVIVPIVIVSIAVWSWVFARPALVERIAMQAGLPRPTSEMWRRATLLSALGVLAIGALGVASSSADPSLAHAASPLAIALCTAVVLDLVDDARAHRTKLAPAAVLHQIQRAGVIERVLAAADIPCHTSGGNLRALLAFFGPWAPAVVLVPAEHAERARQLIDDTTRAPTGTVPTAVAR